VTQPEDCRTCGACCAYADHFVEIEVDGNDADVPDDVVGDDLYLRCKLGTHECVALIGRVGDSVSCGIYDRRPQACRSFEPGSDGCLQCRAHHGLDNRRPRGNVEQSR